MHGMHHSMRTARRQIDTQHLSRWNRPAGFSPHNNTMENHYAGIMLGGADNISDSNRGRMLGCMALSVYLVCNRYDARLLGYISGG